MARLLREDGAWKAGEWNAPMADAGFAQPRRGCRPVDLAVPTGARPMSLSLIHI